MKMKKTPVTRADLERELLRLWPARMASPAFAQRPSLTLDVPGVLSGYQCSVNLGRGATLYAGGGSKQTARRTLLENLQELAPAAPPARVRSPSCTVPNCRWLEGGYCGMCSPNCPHGNPYDSPAACAVCENST